jgi:hypothetical protein
MQVSSWGSLGSLTERRCYLYVGAGRLMYLKKHMICYANELLGSPGTHLLQEFADFFCKRAPGDPQAHLLIEI